MKKNQNHQKTESSVKAKRSVFPFLLSIAMVLTLLFMPAPQLVHAAEEDLHEQTLEYFNKSGTFESGIDPDWNFSPSTPETNKTKPAESPFNDIYGNIYDFWSPVSISYTMTQKLTLPAGSYKLTADVMGYDGMQVYVYFNGKVSTDCVEDPGWNNWQTVGENSVFTLSEETEIEAGIYVILKDNAWGDTDNILLTNVDSTSETGTQDFSEIGNNDGGDSGDDSDSNKPDTTTAVDAGIRVDKINGLSADFIEGVDVSSYISEKNSGVKYYDFEGNELDDQGFFNLLHNCGVNYVRIRVWNNPFDENGHGYGGGNNDIDAAEKIGKWATNAGMKVLIDFHYSDFWTDPGKQYVPKAWEGMNLEAKAKALSDFTTKSLDTLLESGVNVGMVQVGNETNAKFCGESDWDSICELFQAGCSAVRSAASSHNKNILIALHFADPQNGQYAGYAKQLAEHKVDYDVFASSYYPFFHGTTDNLTRVLKQIADTYGKKVMVAETSWATTLEDGDGHDNQIRKGNNDTRYYDFSVYGQATEVRTVMQAVTDVGDAGIGVFYWEPAWIPVNVYDKDADNAEEVLKANRTAWEKFGSGWASSYAGGYQEDAATWYGGSAMDNQAMFDFYGHPLESLKVFSYVRTGAIAVNPAPASVTVEDLTIEEGSDFTLPQASVTYTDGTTATLAVNWDKEDLAAAEAGGPGTYKIHGTISIGETSAEAVCTLTVTAKNYLDDPSLEEGTSQWTYTDKNIFSRKEESQNALTGKYALKFYSEQDFNASASRTVLLDKGTYCLGAYLQGGDVGENAVFTLCASINGKEISKDSSAKVNGWNNWVKTELSPIEIQQDNTELKITVKLENIAGGGWGSWDDFYINLLEEPHSHDLIKTESKDASCTENGNIEYYTCRSCGLIFSDPEGKNEISVEETLIPATGHQPGEWIIDSEATETSEGAKHIECSICGKVLASETIPALDSETQNPVIDSETQNPVSDSGTQNPVSDSETQNPVSDSKAQNHSNETPQTGDSRNIFIWILLTSLSLSTIGGLILKESKKYR